MLACNPEQDGTRRVIGDDEYPDIGYTCLPEELISRMPETCIVLEMKILTPPESIQAKLDQMDAIAARDSIAEGDRLSEHEAMRELGL